MSYVHTATTTTFPLQLFDVKEAEYLESLQQLPKAAVVYADVPSIDDLADVVDHLQAIIQRQTPGNYLGSLVLPYRTSLFVHKEILDKAAATGIFSIVRTESESRDTPESVVWRHFTPSKPPSGTQSWVDDLAEYRKQLPDPKEFGSNPALFEYFR